MLYRFLITAMAVFAGATEAFAWDKIRVRAREHFETHKYKLGDTGQSETYKGLTNTINIWYERPFEYSVGLALGPVIGGARSDGPSDAQPAFGGQIQLAVAGIEAKYFPISGIKGFLRGGLSWNSLRTNGTYGRINGYGYYGGLGWEIPIGIVSIAPEVAFRRVHLAHDVTGDIFTPSIGLHFYKELR